MNILFLNILDFITTTTSTSIYLVQDTDLCLLDMTVKRQQNLIFQRKFKIVSIVVYKIALHEIT